MAAGEPGPIRAGADAPVGETASLERMALARRQPAPVTGAGAAPVQTGVPSPGQTSQGGGLPELNGGYDPALFGPSDRPNEPITSGAPFGPGPAFVPTPQEDSRTFMLRVADSLSQTPELASYVARIRAGA